MKRIATLAAAVALAAPGAALAQSSATCQAYHPQLCQPATAAANAGGGGGATGSTSSGTLPFTGLDVALLAVGGGTLLGAGFVVRRLSRRLD